MSQDGAFSIDDINLVAEKDVTIEDIYFYEQESSEVEQVSILQNSEGEEAIDSLWNRENVLQLSQGETIKLKVDAVDTFFANKIFALTNRVLIIEYLCDGETYYIPVEVSFRMRSNGYEMYTALEDKE